MTELSKLRDEAEALEDQGDFEGAVKVYSRAIEIAPSDAELYYDRALAHQTLGAHDACRDDIARSLEVAPDFAPALAYRALTRWEEGDPQAALSDLTRAIELMERESPRGAEHEQLMRAEKAENHYLRGLIYDDLCDRSAALTEFRSATAIDPSRADEFKRGAIAGYGWEAMTAQIVPVADTRILKLRRFLGALLQRLTA